MCPVGCHSVIRFGLPSGSKIGYVSALTLLPPPLTRCTRPSDIHERFQHRATSNYPGNAEGVTTRQFHRTTISLVFPRQQLGRPCHDAEFVRHRTGNHLCGFTEWETERSRVSVRAGRAVPADHCEDCFVGCGGANDAQYVWSDGWLPRVGASVSSRRVSHDRSNSGTQSPRLTSSHG